MSAKGTRDRIRHHAKKAVEDVDQAQQHLAVLKQIRDDALPEEYVFRDDSITNSVPEFITALDTMQTMLEEWLRRL